MTDEPKGDINDEAYIEAQLQKLYPEVDRMLEGMLSRRRRRKLKDQPHPLKPIFFKYGRPVAVTIVIAVLFLGAVLVLRSIASTPAQQAVPPSKDRTIVWADQYSLPESMLGLMASEHPKFVASVLSNLYGAYMKQAVPAETFVVPNNQSVIVVARLSSQARAPYAMAASNFEGDFTESCVIEAGGMLTQIGSESGRMLVSYKKPPSVKGSGGEGRCTGNELFFEQLN